MGVVRPAESQREPLNICLRILRVPPPRPAYGIPMNCSDRNNTHLHAFLWGMLHDFHVLILDPATDTVWLMDHNQ